MTLFIQHHSQGKGKSLVTTTAIKAGTVFHKMENVQSIDSPTFTSIQIDTHLHIEEFYAGYLNHSCSPSVILDTEKMEFRAARDIQAGEELTYFYPSTEWEMSTPFPCLCQSLHCQKFVAGAKFVSEEALHQYFINPHIARMLERSSIRA
jgi:hypothetical protein